MTLYWCNFYLYLYLMSQIYSGTISSSNCEQKRSYKDLFAAGKSDPPRAYTSLKWDGLNRVKSGNCPLICRNQCILGEIYFKNCKFSIGISKETWFVPKVLRSFAFSSLVDINICIFSFWSLFVVSLLK